MAADTHRSDSCRANVLARGAIAVLAILLTSTAQGDKPMADERPTAAFRSEHAQVQEHLRHVHDWVGALSAQAAGARKQTAQKVVAFFESHIKPHAEWEERFLYPIVDELAGAGANRFTSTMRHEHRIVGRWIGELRAESEKPSLDAARFARRTDNLLGLIWAHFEEEEEVLLPFIDRGMSKAQFEERLREIGSAREQPKGKGLRAPRTSSAAR